MDYFGFQPSCHNIMKLKISRASFILDFLFIHEDERGMLLETLVAFNQTTYGYVTEERIVHSHFCENLRSGWCMFLQHREFTGQQ
jgi:hypothetical protein